MKKRLLIVGLVALVVVGAVACGKKENLGNIKDSVISIKNLNGHNRKDVEKVFDIIKKEFKTEDFKDCNLISISYDGDSRSSIEESLKSEKSSKEAISLEFTFKTGKNPDVVFNKESEYTYSADFIKDDKNNWKMVNWGQG